VLQLETDCHGWQKDGSCRAVMVKQSRKNRKKNQRRAALLHTLKNKHAYTIDGMADFLGISHGLMTDYLAGEEMYLSDAVGLTILLGASLEDIACLTEQEWRAGL
jgi:hypothetical protein